MPGTKAHMARTACNEPVAGFLVRGLCALAIAFAFLMATAVRAGAAEPEAVRQVAPLKFANRTIIELKGPLAGHTAESRVRETRERIDKALEAEPYAQITF